MERTRLGGRGVLAASSTSRVQADSRSTCTRPGPPRARTGASRGHRLRRVEQPVSKKPLVERPPVAPDTFVHSQASERLDAAYFNVRSGRSDARRPIAGGGRGVDERIASRFVRKREVLDLHADATFDLGLRANELLSRRLRRKAGQDAVRAAMRPDLDAGGCHRPRLLPVDEEPPARNERSAQAHRLAERLDQIFDGLFITERLHGFYQHIEVARLERTNRCEASQLVPDRVGVMLEPTLVRQQTRNVSLQEEVNELGVPERTVRSDEVRRKVNGRGYVAPPEDR